MKLLRIKLTQNKAHYRKEETVVNKMTYPLPPPSTVIGAIHTACSYDSYNPMDISIQGNYQHIGMEERIYHGILNVTADDRNTLVYMVNPQIQGEGSYVRVAKCIGERGKCSFEKEENIKVYDKQLLERYKKLKSKRREVLKENTLLNQLIDDLENNKNQTEDKTKKKKLIQQIKEVKHLKKNKMDEEYTIPFSHFNNLIDGISYTEVLYNVELVIHIKAQEEVLINIKNNINNLVSIGRSEDFVEIQGCRMVDIVPGTAKKIKDYSIFISKDSKNIAKNGTVYYLNKTYTIKDNVREFNKVKVLYSKTDQIKGMYDQSGYAVSLI